MIAEVLRVVGQLLVYAVAQRRVALLILVALGMIALALSAASSAAAPILIYPVL